MSNEKTLTDIYTNVVLSTMRDNGFDIISDPTFERHRYVATFRYKREGLKSDQVDAIFGSEENEILVDLIGIPVGNCVFVHSMVRNMFDIDNVKVKLKRREMDKNLRAMRDEFYEDFVIKLIELLSMKIDELPPELQLKIISYLPFAAVLQLDQTSKFYRDLCRDSDELIWKPLFRYRFLYTVSSPRVNHCETWKELFKEEYIKEKHNTRLREQWLLTRGLPSPPIFPALPSPPMLPLLGPPPPPPFFPIAPPLNNAMLPPELRNPIPLPFGGFGGF